MIQDVANNPINPTATSFLGFRPPLGFVAFPHDIYSFFIEPIRQCDKDAGDQLLLRFLAVMQDEFEATQERIRSLQDIYDPERAPSAALDHLRWLVGFTKALDGIVGDLTENELRRLIAIAPELWSLKGSEAGIVQSIRRLTYRNPRLLNYFDFRLLLDEWELGREELGFDPWLLNEPGFTPSVPPSAIDYDPLSPGVMTFELASIFGVDDETGETVRVTYKPTKTSELLTVYFDSGVSKVTSGTLLGQTDPPSLDLNDYLVGVEPDEYVSDIRIQDPKDGTVNRDFIADVVRLQRPANERYYLRWVDFFDQFVVEDFRWETVSGTVDYSPETGVVNLEDGGADTFIQTDEPLDASWGEQVASAQFLLRDNAGYGEMRFYVTDSDNFYALRLEPDGGIGATLKLDRVTGGVRTTLDSVVIPVFHLGVYYFYRVATADTGGGHQIKFYLDEDHLGTVVDSDHTAGKLGLAVSAGNLSTVTFAEVYTIPLEETYLGINE